MRRVVHKLGLNLGIDAGVLVVRGVRLLVENVVVTRGPLTRAETGGERAVVNHEGDAASVHVRVERVNGFDDRLVAHFGVGVTLFAEGVDLRHHARAVHTGGERVERDFALDALGANAGANLPHVRLVDLTHREAVEAIASHDDGSDFVRGLHFFVAFVVDVLARLVSRGEGFHEGLLVLDGFVHCLDALGGDDLRDRTGDALDGVLEGIFIGHACASVSAEQRLYDTVDATEQDTALTVDVGAVFHLERSRERERRADGNGPAEGDFRGGTGRILVHSERSVNARPVRRLTLFIQSTNRRTHTLRRDEHDVDVVAKLRPLRVHHPEQESVRQPERRARLHRRQNARVHLRLRRIGDQQHHQVALRDDVERLPERPVRLVKSNSSRLRVRR